jgi:hypothetical protein
MATRIVVVAFALLLASAASAQPAGYNTASETSVSGVIRYVISAMAPDGTVGVHLELRTNEGPVRVHLAPAMFIGMNNFSFYTDDIVAIRGAKVTRGSETAVWARLIVKDGKTLVLRDDDGTPRWPRATFEDPDGCGVTHDPIR